MSFTFPDEMVASFFRYYGKTPEQLFDEGMYADDVAALAVNLPRESAVYATAVPVSEAERWGVEGHMMAKIIDLLAAANWQRSGGNGPRPKRVERPSNPMESTADEIRDEIAEFEAHRAALRERQAM